jgi:hypothetical protein
MHRVGEAETETDKCAACLHIVETGLAHPRLPQTMSLDATLTGSLRINHTQLGATLVFLQLALASPAFQMSVSNRQLAFPK